jgi:tRNA(Ile2) C34 agmatinyltransferase TiaS
MARRDTSVASPDGAQRSYIIKLSPDDLERQDEVRPFHCGQKMVGNGTNRWLCTVCAYQPVKVRRPVPIIPGPTCPHCNTKMRSKGIQWLCHKCNKWFAKHRMDK